MLPAPSSFPTGTALLAALALVGAAPGAQCELPSVELSGAPAEFGGALACRGDRLLVGAPSQDGLHAYVFVRDRAGTPGVPIDDAWLHAATLERPAGDSQFFGRAVELGDDVALVGAPGHVFGGVGIGAVHVFYRVGSTWVTGPELSVPTDGDEYFGSALALEGPTLFVGAPGSPGSPGSVYAFQRLPEGDRLSPLDDVWVETQRLQPSDGEPGDGFGQAVGASADHLLVGAPGEDALGHSSGALYAFARDDGGTAADPLDDAWVETAKLLDSQGGESHFFGSSLDVDGGLAAVGAPSHLLFQLDGTTVVLARDDAGTPDEPLDDSWSEVSHLRASDEAADPFANTFGASVSLRGDRLLVSAPLAGVGTGAEPNGAAYLFGLLEPDGPCGTAEPSWVELARLVDADLGPSDAFAGPVALEAGVGFVGGVSGPSVTPYVTATGAWLRGLPAEVSTSAGETQTLSLAACPAHVGDAYWVFGSISGTTPGFGLGGLHVPLNPDVYLGLTIFHPNAAPLESSFGILDLKSSGTARFTVPKAKPALAGLEVHHAVLVLDGASGSFVQVSDAESVAVTP